MQEFCGSGHFRGRLPWLSPSPPWSQSKFFCGGRDPGRKTLLAPAVKSGHLTLAQHPLSNQHQLTGPPGIGDKTRQKQVQQFREEWPL